MSGASEQSSGTKLVLEGGFRKLWMINQYAISPDMPGGSRHFELAYLLKQSGWYTTIFATPFSHKTASFLRNVSLLRPYLSEDEQGVRFRWLYSLPYVGNGWRRYVNMLTFSLGLIPSKTGEGKPDVVLGSSPHLLAAFGGWLLAKWFKVPFVLEIRDLWPDTLIQMGLTNKTLIMALEWIERFLYQRASLIIYLTEGIGDGIASKGIEKDKLLFLPNAALRPAPLDHESREQVRRRLGWGDDVVAIYAGAHGPANALEKVVAAAGDLPADAGLRIVFLGDGPSKPHLREQAEGMSHVTFLDPVSKAEVSSILRAADVGILSLQQNEVFEGARPNKLFDYLANGLPVVSTIGGEVCRVLSEAEAGFYVPPQSLATALWELVLDPERRARMGLNGLDYVTSTLTREDTAHLLARHLDRLKRENQEEE
jgi:glycosyltransferase involved in cell wall biosynthesis